MPKIRIAVRMPDKSRRLYRVDDAGMTVDQMRAATLAEVPTASVVLIGLPRLVVDEPLAAA